MPSTVMQERWKQPDTFATTLLVMFLDRFGTDGLKWDPNTIAMEVEEAFHVDLPALNFDRLMAGIALLKSDAFYQDLPTFIELCNVLSGDTYDPRTWDPADSYECSWGIIEALLLSPPDQNDDEPFSEEIRAYIGAVLDSEGIINPPDILQLAIRMPLNNHPNTYTDDPEMYGAIYDFEASKTSDIRNQLKRSIGALANQLEALPLRTGDARNIIDALIHSAV